MRDATNGGTSVGRRLRRTWLWLAAVPVLAAVGVLAAEFSAPQTSASYFLMSAAALLYFLVLTLRRPRPAAAVPTSLIQRRMALDRQRTAAVGGIVLLVIMGTSAATSTVLRGRLDGFAVGVFVILLVVGWSESGRLYVQYRRDLRAFEAAHGKDAGRQVPVRVVPGREAQEDPAGDRGAGGS